MMHEVLRVLFESDVYFKLSTMGEG
jgi:hypothetical protein